MREKINLTDARLDQLLDEQSCSVVSQVVKELPEEQVSLVWRSELNQKIAAMAGKRRRAMLLSWMWKPAVGMAVCTALVVAVFVRRDAASVGTVTPLVQDAGFERALVREHLASASSIDVAAEGFTPAESADSKGSAAPLDWDREDITSAL